MATGLRTRHKRRESRMKLNSRSRALNESIRDRTNCSDLAPTVLQKSLAMHIICERMTLQGRTRLGPYEVVSRIGAGGMGEVYEARDTRLDRRVAIKILASSLGNDPEFRARFAREAKSISAINHPHICGLFDIGREQETDYLVLELLQGETLASRLERGPLPLAKVLQHGIEIADALAAAHRLGIVHRDLKPANIMITPSGTKLLDFGLAKLTMNNGDGTLPCARLRWRATLRTAHSSARCRTWHPSNCRVRQSMRGPTCLRSGRCSMRWLPVVGRSMRVHPQVSSRRF